MRWGRKGEKGGGLLRRGSAMGVSISAGPGAEVGTEQLQVLADGITGDDQAAGQELCVLCM